MSSSFSREKMQSKSRVFSSDNMGSVGLEEMESLKDQASKLYLEGKFSQAVIGYTYAIKQLAQVLIPANRRALVSMDHAGQVSLAIRDAKVSQKGRTLAAALFNNRSAAYLKMNRFDRAALDAGAAATIDPENFKAWLRKATAHKELAQWYECNQAVKAAMKLDDKNEDILAMLEESQFKMGASMSMPHMAPPAAAPHVAHSQSRRRFGVF